jgi:DNA-binding transcriptional MerR regulator
MKMRELEQRTGVNREVIRIMIRKGLLPEPERPARNAAEYGEAHIRGIAAVRELQQSSRMTLKEIKAALEGGGLDSMRPTAAVRHLDALLAGLFGLDEAPLVTLAALESRWPHARRDAAAFERLSMLQIADQEGESALTRTDARMIEIWGTIREAGFVEETGFPPDNIAFYLEAARMVARREAEIFFGNSRVPIDDEQGARMLHTALPLMLDFFGLLRLKSFIEELDQGFE